MLQQAFEQIMNEYPKAKSESFLRHPLAHFIRNEIPQYLANAIDNHQLSWEASVGQGGWADAPWIAGLHGLVTDSPMRGYYPVYLFNRSLTGVYLSFNQGMSNLKKELKTSPAKQTLKHHAMILRERLPESKRTFQNKLINLEASTPNARLAMYEPGHAFGKYYEKGRIPKTEVLLSDLQEMVHLYQLVIYRGGYDEFTASEINDEQDDSSESNPENLTEQRCYHLHRVIERNQKLVKKVKKVHKYVCEVCGFDFEKRYGTLGHEFIEAHHIIPLASLEENVKVSLSPQDDFAVLCSNCHRMVHRKGAPTDFEEFKKKYAK